MKKLAALSIAMIVLIGLSLLALPMPSEARLTPEIFVSPPKKKFFAPCNVSNTLDIEIKIFNEFEDTGAEIYALDFKLLWNTSLLKLVEIHIKPPFDDATKYFIIKNTTGVITAYIKATPNHPDPWGDGCWDYYWLAFTALDTTPGIKDKVAIVNLKFHIEKEPCWPDVFLSPLYLYQVTMSGPCGVPLPYGFTEEHGDFYIGSTKPDMTITPEEIINDCQCKNFTLSISISNFANGYGFGFKITFNSTLLEANVQCVKILFPQPFASQRLVVGAGYVIVEVERPCEKPPLACGDMVVATICLHAIWPKEVLPHNWNDDIKFEWAYVTSKCPDKRVYQIVSVEEVGKGKVTPTSTGVSLYVADGTKDWAGIDIPVDIALKDIAELKFDEMVSSFGASGWSVNVILGVDADGDGVFEADIPAWHGVPDPTTMHDITVLNGDTFVEMDGATGPLVAPLPWTTTNALPVKQWWTPDDGTGPFAFASSVTYPWSFYDNYANFINIFLPDPTQTSLIPNVNARVKLVKLLIGGSGSWMGETAWVKNLVLNGQCYPLWSWLNVYGATYYWRPKREDLNVDCHVDIIDLGAIAKVYGLSHAWSYLVLPGGKVDLYDVVAVAKMFCKTVTPKK